LRRAYRQRRIENSLFTGTGQARSRPLRVLHLDLVDGIVVLGAAAKPTSGSEEVVSRNVAGVAAHGEHGTV